MSHLNAAGMQVCAATFLQNVHFMVVCSSVYRRGSIHRVRVLLVSSRRYACYGEMSGFVGHLEGVSLQYCAIDALSVATGYLECWRVVDS